MLCAHITSDNGDCLCRFGYRENLSRRLRQNRRLNVRLCCAIEGKDWADCLRKYHEHMGWDEPAPDSPLYELSFYETPA